MEVKEQWVFGGMAECCEILQLHNSRCLRCARYGSPSLTHTGRLGTCISVQSSVWSCVVHIGLIGGIGPAATEFYYRGLVARHAGLTTPLELSIVHADARELSTNNVAGNANKQAQVFLDFVRRLNAAGAQAAAITSIGGHFCIDKLIELSPIPILNAIPVIAERVRQVGLKKVGLLGTGRVMNSKLYGGISTASVVVPHAAELGKVHQIYIAMALSGKVTDQQRSDLFSIGQSLCRDQGAEAILLAGTGLFLAFDGQACGFTVMDCAQIHMDALHSAAIGDS
jgi:aspartate racemase